MQSNTLSRVLLSLSVVAFSVAAGAICAYVYDIEHVPPEKVYQMERDLYNHGDGCWKGDFPTFEAWVKEQAAKEVRAREWIDKLVDRVGQDAAETFDWTLKHNEDGDQLLNQDQWNAKYGRD